MTYGNINQYNEIGASSGLEDASPHRIIQMLMQKFIDHMSAIQGAIARNDMATKGLLISKALAIVQHLHQCLDMDNGGDISNQLSDLYSYIQKEITYVNLKNDGQLASRLKDIMVEIKSGWDQVPQVLADQSMASAGQ